MSSWQTQWDHYRRDHRAPLAIAGILCLFILLGLWSTLGDFLKHPVVVSVPKPAPLSPAPNISDLHLLGIFSSNVTNLPDTTLQLTLEGTVVAVDAPIFSRALISLPNQPAKVYSVGDKLPGDATITKITNHYVVLNDNGTLEKLPLPIKTVFGTS